ncbi:hypothetical protein AB0N71_15315 [Pseudarthrobacter enclensis]|uniref:hypothetical protein n=1 Tax=Pseudarthrobacter enclensis TaxID=993070 RepID=UPI003434AB05
MTSAPTLAELIANAEADGHDHASTEKSTGLRHIHNHAAGTVVWFPTWKTFRTTADWTEAVDAAAAELAKSEPADDKAATILAEEHAALLQAAAVSGDAAAFAGENLSKHLTRAWTLGDAAARAAGRDLPTSGSTAASFGGYPYDVYAGEGSAFASALFNDLVDARRQRILAEEAARKALKPVSRKALKNAARKAARR